MLSKSGPMTSRLPIPILHGCVLALSLLPLVIYGQSPASGNTAAEAGPDFVLVGTSRIGNRHSATLQLSSGKQIVVVSENGNAVPLSGFSGYTVTKIEAGRVSIRHTSDSACAAFPDQGVVCDAEETTALELRVRALDDVAEAGPAQAVIRLANDLTDIRAESGSFINKIQAEAAQRGVRPEVPDGMALIETATGYRLIPDD